MLNASARAVTIRDLERASRRRLPRMVYDFISGGAENEFTLRENERAFDDVALRSRVLVDVRDRPQAVTVLGQQLRMPVILGPAGLIRLASPIGETAAAVAAESHGTVSVVSSGSSVSFEDVASAVRSPQWFQLYPWGDRSTIQTLIRRAKDCGYAAMVVTVDVPVLGLREKDLRNGLTIPPEVNPRNAWDVATHPRWLSRLVTARKVTYANFGDLMPEERTTSGLAATTNGLLNPGHTWADLAWMIDQWGGPVLLKGVMTGEDARRAVEVGCDGVAVSNHGGRQADGVPAGLDMLEEIVGEVGHEADVVLDGGVRRGADVVKALSLGARACLIGRPWVYGVAVDGARGATRVLEILHDEIDRTLALIGRPGVRTLDLSAVSSRPNRGWSPMAAEMNSLDSSLDT